MSGFSDEKDCPNCGSSKYSVCIDWKPFDTMCSQCYDCGFYTSTRIGIDNLEELNEERLSMEEWGDEPLKTLLKPKEQTEWAKENMKHYINDFGVET